MGCHGESPGSPSTIKRALYILYCIEGGVFLILAPWSPLWADNALLRLSEGLEDLVTSSFCRGAVSGVGAMLLLLGLEDIVRYARSALRGKP